MKCVKGDLIALAKKGHFDAIAHGANCFCTMGAGVALAVAKAFPEAAAADSATQSGYLGKLGTCSRTTVVLESGQLLDVVNCYTQFRPGRNLDYTALAECFGYLAYTYNGLSVGLPKIGCGIAGGDWNVVEEMIKKVLDPVCDVTIVVFE